jgi:tetratricopeptide (TPR) repeat protein
MTTMHRSLASIVLALGIGAAGSHAYAQATPAPRPGAAAPPATPKKTPTQTDLAQARKHFQAAEAAKARAEYRTAAVEYLAAYELFQEPAFFYDTAEVYRLAGDEQNALAYYEKYLELDTHGQGAANARTAVDLLRRSIAAREDAAQRALAEARPKPDAEARPEADSAGRRVDAANAASSKPARPAAPTTPATVVTAKPIAAPPPGRGLRIGGIAAGGTGLVALGIGVAFGLKARSISDQVSNADMYDKSRDAQGHAAQRNMYLFTGVGAAALVTGGVLYYLGDRARKLEPSGAALTLAPVVGPSEISFAVGGRF